MLRLRRSIPPLTYNGIFASKGAVYTPCDSTRISNILIKIGQDIECPRVVSVAIYQRGSCQRVLGLG